MSRHVSLVEAAAMADLAELLGDESSLRLLFELQAGPCTLGELASRCNEAEACLGPVLDSLRHSGIVERRDDRFALGSAAVRRFLAACGGVEPCRVGLGADLRDSITLH